MFVELAGELARDLRADLRDDPPPEYALKYRKRTEELAALTRRILDTDAARGLGPGRPPGARPAAVERMVHEALWFLEGKEVEEGVCEVTMPVPGVDFEAARAVNPADPGSVLSTWARLGHERAFHEPQAVRLRLPADILRSALDGGTIGQEVGEATFHIEEWIAQGRKASS